MVDTYFKLPRLYTDQPLKIKGIVSLQPEHAHYLRAVLRRKTGDTFRVFNGKDGEFLAEITEIGKKDGQATLQELIREQQPQTDSIHLLFAPLKKHRMDFIIEKSVELGVTDFHPVITARTEVKKINTERLEKQIIEAAEQCERMALPRLHSEQKLAESIGSWDRSVPLYACLERSETRAVQDALAPGDVAFLIGPVGGFDDEIAFLKVQKHLTTVSLGEDVLRCETAALACLALARFRRT